MRDFIILILCIVIVVSGYFNYLNYVTTDKSVSFDQKKTCASYQTAMRQQIEDYHGRDTNFEIREVFYSTLQDSCLYYYVFTTGNGNNTFVIRDYLANKVINESKPVSLYGSDEYKKTESDFESSLNTYR